jgi:hypothetical protein
MSKRKKDKSKPRRTGRVKPTDAQILRLPERGDPVTGLLEEFPEHAKLIAYIVSEWTALEHKLALLTMFAANHAPERFAIRSMIYAIESSKARLDAMHAAMLSLAQSEGIQVSALSTMFDGARQLLTQRNRYAHAMYGKNGSTGELIRIDLKSDESVEVPLYDLEQQFQRMRNHSNAVGSVVAGVFAHIEKRRTERAQSQDEPQSPPNSDDVHIGPLPQERPESSQE